MSGKPLRTVLWIVLTAVLIGLGIWRWMDPSQPGGAGPSDEAGESVVTGGPAAWSADQRQHVAEHYDAARQYMNNARFGQAEQLLTEITEQYPGDPEGLNLLARVQRAQERGEQAYDTVQRSLAINDEQPEMHHFAGVLAEQQDRLDTAVRHYQRAADGAPDRAKYHLYLANALMKTEQFDPAQLHALKTLQLDDTAAQAHILLANIAEQKNQLQRAIEQVDKALASVGTDGRGYESYLLKKLHLLRQSGVAGREEALNVLTALPEEVRQRERLVAERALTHLSLGEPVEAARVWEARLERRPLDARAAAEAGLAWYRAGDTEKARRYLRKARSLKPHINEVRALAQALGE